MLLEAWNLKGKDGQDEKGPHTLIYLIFSISFYNVNQMSMFPIELIFTVKPQGLNVFLGEIKQFI